MKSKCLVCALKEAIYKCPNCYLPFCSVACGKAHKETPCQPHQHKHPPLNHHPSEKHRYADDDSLADSSVLSPQHLCALDHNDEVQRKIRDERLMAILERIDKASNPANALEKEMRNPEFEEFCDDVLEALQMKHSETETLS